MSNYHQFNEDDINLLEKAFSESVSNIIGTMAGLEISNTQIITDNITLPGSQHVGIMFLIGNINALLAVTMSNITAATLVSYITGIPVSELGNKDIQDGVSELVNMISGSAKAFLKETKFYFQLTSPITITGQDQYLTHKGRGNKLFIRFYFEDKEINLIYLIL